MKNLLKFLVLIFTITVTFKTFAIAEKSPSEILSDAWNIEGKINFVATEITGMYMRNRFHIAVSKVYSSSENKFRREYLFPPFLVGDLVIDDGDKSYYYQPQKEQLTISPSIFKPSQRELHNRILQLILKNYNIVTSRDRFLNREVTRVSIYQKEGKAPLLVLWIDNQTNLILKREKYLPNGKIYEYSFYTDIDFDTTPNERLFVWIKPKERFRIIERKERFISLEEAKRRGIEIPISFQGEGYECINIKEVPGGIVYNFSDGINNFMLFDLENLPPIPVPFKRVTIDGIRYSYWQTDGISGFAWDYNKRKFLVIGVIDRNTIERLIKSIR